MTVQMFEMQVYCARFVLSVLPMPAKSVGNLGHSSENDIQM